MDDPWCPVCNRLIKPKKYAVPASKLPPRASSAPPPTSPQSSSTKKDRKPAVRTRGGLVQSTGRVKPNGTAKSASRSLQAGTKPVKYRTVIDQGPLPLYCSEECKRLDDQASSGFVDTERSSSSSIPSELSSTSTASSATFEQLLPPRIAQESEYASPSVALIAKLYNFPPPPPPAIITFADATEEIPCRAPLSDNGLIMAGRYLRELVAPPAKPQTGRYREPIKPVKTIPGWNDGSNAWRARLYNLSTPTPTPQIKRRVVRSTLGDASIPLRAPSTPSVPDNTALINKYAELLPRCMPSSERAASKPKREQSILPPGVEGKLLVPDVKLKVRTGTGAFIEPRNRSPLPAPSELADNKTVPSKSDSSKSPVMSTRRPVPETRSWSYDNFKTYDLMPFPTKKEKRTQITIVDGKQVRSEVEVEVQPYRQRLFLFPAPVRAS